jgi:hypothetical protein
MNHRPPYDDPAIRQAAFETRDAVIATSREKRDGYMRKARLFGWFGLKKKARHNAAMARGMNQHVVQQIQTGRRFGEAR